MTRSKRPRKGDIVALYFIDHVEDSSDLFEFVVYGRLAEVGRSKYVVDCWAFKDPGQEYDGNNVKRFAIVRRAVKRVEILEPRHEAEKEAG